MEEQEQLEKYDCRIADGDWAAKLLREQITQQQQPPSTKLNRKIYAAPQKILRFSSFSSVANKRLISS